MGATALNIMLAFLLVTLVSALIFVVVRGGDGKTHKFGAGMSIYDIVEKVTGRPVSLTHRLALTSVLVAVLLAISIFISLKSG